MFRKKDMRSICANSAEMQKKKVIWDIQIGFWQFLKWDKRRD